jgi:hypothetical protein
MATPETPRSAGESSAWKWLVGVALPLLAVVAGLAGGWIEPQQFWWWPWRADPALLYAADWSRDLNGWPASSGWTTADGALVNFSADNLDGSCPDNWIPAPWDAGATADYAIETDLELSRQLDAIVQGDPPFVVDLVLRSGYYLVLGSLDQGPGQGMVPGMQLIAVDAAGPRVLATVAPFPVEGARHLYRFEAAGDQLRVWVDGLLKMEVRDATFGRGGKVGLWCRDATMTVHSFKVVRL